MAFLEIKNLKKDFDRHSVVKDFSMSIEEGEFITFLGPSGCGKTTILRMLAGFEPPSAGNIVFDGKDVTALPVNRRNVGMVFQSYALFPNLTVAQNIGFGLRVAKLPKAQIEARVQEMLVLIQLEGLADRYPWQMSGGQQQRVALARALANRPKVLLLDEPLSALDAKIRLSLRQDIRALQRKLGITTVFVTHDQEEALSISDRIVVLHDGAVEQVGAPAAIYNFPKTRFVASFIGTLNQLSGVVVDPAVGSVRVGTQTLISASPMADLSSGDACTLVLRPEAISLMSQQPGKNSVNATVEDINFLGSIVRIRARLGESLISLDIFNDPNAIIPTYNSEITLVFAYESLLVLT